MAYAVTYNSYALQNSSFRTRIIQHTDLPTKLIQTEPKARDSGTTLVDARYSTRRIEVEGVLTAADRDTLVTTIDAMKLALSDPTGTLDIDYGNSTRRYYAIVQNIDIPEDFYNISQVPYRITFLCPDPFGYATSSGVVNLAGRTEALFTRIITLSGSVSAEPSIQLTINTATDMQLLTVANDTTGEILIINKPGGNFANGDVVIINTQDKRVHINNSGVDYTGRFPTLDPFPTHNLLRVAISATAVDYDLRLQYVPRYL